MVELVDEIVGVDDTVTVVVLFDVHPFVVPVTVYTVVIVGDTFKVDVVAPVFQLYVVAPVAVNVVLAPEHIVVVFTDIVGCGVTPTFTVVEPVHVPLKPTMVYVVLLVGFTVTELPFVDIGNHV